MRGFFVGEAEKQSRRECLRKQRFKQEIASKSSGSDSFCPDQTGCFYICYKIHEVLQIRKLS